MNAPVDHFRRSVATLLLVAQGVAPISALAAPAVAPVAPRPAAPAHAAAPAAAHSPIVVQRALGLYQQARYDEAVTLLIGPVSRGELKGVDLREARIVLARCYVKKGLPDRAADHFAAILAAEPAFMLDSSKVDAEELAAFRELLPPSASAPLAGATPVGPQGAPTPAPAAPKGKTPGMRAALPPGSGSAKKGWLSSHKSIAALVAVAGGGAIAALAAGGGGGGTPAIPPTPTVPDFPPPPPTP